jgi:MYXO-CTERM domain-containing protein
MTRVRRGVGIAAAVLLTAAAVWDLVGGAGILPAWWPRVSHALAGAGIAAACLAIFIRTMQRRRGVPGGSGATAVELLAVGLFLVARMLRGHAEIPPDPPIVGGQLVALGLLAWAAWRRRRRPT